MIIVHHLNDSRSQRVLWLLEELACLRDSALRARRQDPSGAAELVNVHPLGKSPVIEDGDQKVIESGAIVDYLIRRHGGGRLQPAAARPISRPTSNGCTMPKARPCCR